MKNKRLIWKSSSSMPERNTLSASFLRHYAQYQPSPKSHRHIGIICLVCVVGVFLKPGGGALNVRASSLGLQPNGHEVTVTAYTNIPSCTDSSPDETASLLRIRPRHYGKIIALSRDLAKRYKYGDRFHLWVNGEEHLVEFQDLMAKRHSNRIDVLLPSKKKCLNFGVSEGVLVPADTPVERVRTTRSGKS